MINFRGFGLVALLLAIVLVGVLSVAQAADFEGVISMKMTGQSEKGAEMTYYLKGPHTRIEMGVGNGPQMAQIYDMENAKITTLMPAQKMYMTMDLKAMGDSMKGMGKGKSGSETGDSKFPKLTDTGKQETIAGFPCEHWLMGDKQEMDMCMAKGLGYFGMGGAGGGSLGTSLMFSPKLLAQAATHPEWVKFLEGGAFPLKLTMMKEGKSGFTMEVTKVEKKSLNDSLFTIPPDYKELNMKNMMQGKQQ